MSLSGTFDPIAAALPLPALASRLRKKRPASFAIRLSPEERSRLEAEAAGVPLGTYIKAKALGGGPLKTRRSGLAVHDRAALGQALVLLGRSNLANNLNQLVRLAHIGAPPFTPDIEAELRSALDDVRELRRLLVAALSLKPEGGSP